MFYWTKISYHEENSTKENILWHSFNAEGMQDAVKELLLFWERNKPDNNVVSTKFVIFDKINIKDAKAYEGTFDINEGAIQ